MIPIGEMIAFPLLLFIPLFMIRNQITELRTHRHCIRYGTEIRGKIVEFKDQGPRSGRSPVFQFRYKGGTQQKAAYQKFEPFFIKLRFQKEMNIYYCEDHPDFVVMKGHGQYILSAFILLLSAGLLLFFAVRMLFLDIPFNLISYGIAAAGLLFYFWKCRKK